MKKIVMTIIDLIFPRTNGYMVLKDYTPSDFYKKVPKISLIHIDIHSCFPYRHNIVKTMIREIKECKNVHATRLAGYAIYKRLESMKLGYVALIPIPTTYMKLCERGYNQCDLIVNAVVENDPLMFLVLKNVLKYKNWLTKGEQKNLRKNERFDMAMEQFVISGELPNNITVVVIDDVVTTGSTLRSAMETIKARCNRVIGISVAH
jgi:predicted amidophosphoribosyltransferase